MTAYRSSLFMGVAILAISGAAQAQSPAPAQINFSIPAGSLAAALNAYASQAGRQLMFTSDQVAGRRSPGLSGRMSADAALDQLLAGSGLVAVDAIGQYRLLGETLDDAAGEAFDKTAKMMGLPYPGGPQLAKLAESGTPGVFKFSRPMTDRPGLDFSFSGLKTQVLLAWKGSDQSAQTRADIARGFEDAVVDTLAIKCARALDAAGCGTLIVAGGVGANKRLRAKLTEMCERRGGRACFPRPALCTDNGAMIAYAGALRLVAGQHEDATIRAVPRWDMAELPLV